MLDNLVEKRVDVAAFQKKYAAMQLQNTPAELDYTFHPPPSILVVGSYLLRTQVKSNLNVDVALEMAPGSLPYLSHYFSEYP